MKKLLMMTVDKGGTSSDDDDKLLGAPVMEELDSNDMECAYPYDMFYGMYCYSGCGKYKFFLFRYRNDRQLS